MSNPGGTCSPCTSDDAPFIIMLSLVGIPPLVGFFGKFLLFEVTLTANHAWLVVLAMLNTLVSLYYYLRVAAVMLFAPSQGEVPTLGRALWLAMLAGFTLLLAPTSASRGSFRA